MNNTRISLVPGSRDYYFLFMFVIFKRHIRCFIEADVFLIELNLIFHTVVKIENRIIS